jgi:hypothetical protein
MEISEKNFLEKLADKIPGLSGYRAKEDRRDTDKRLRQYVGTRLDGVKAKVDAVKLELTDGGNLAALGSIGQFHRRLQRLTDTIRFASYGYSGLFDQMKIREAELDKIYAHDLKMLEVVDLLEGAVATLGTDPAPATKALDALEELVTARKTMWEAPPEG